MGKTKYKSADIKTQYLKERRRIQQFLYRAKKRGYEFAKNVLPKIPKTVTEKSIARLQKISPTSLYEKARVYYNESEYYTGTEYRHMENLERGRKSAETRHYNKYDMKQERQTDYNVIDRIEQLVRSSDRMKASSKYTPDQKHHYLMILQYGKQFGEEYEKHLYQYQDGITKALNDIQYESDPRENLRLDGELIAYLTYEGSPFSLEDLDNLREETVDDIMGELMAENPFI